MSGLTGRGGGLCHAAAPTGVCLSQGPHCQRDPASPEFNALKRELGQLVMEEQQRHHHDELRMAAVD